jgi:hypothetical protein
MGKTTSDFRVVGEEALAKNYYAHLPPMMRSAIAARDSFFGIVKGEELVAVCAFKPSSEERVLVTYTWSNPNTRLLREFSRMFGVTPAIYLKEDLIRQGVKSFEYGSLFKKGERMLKKLMQRGLVTKVTPKEGDYFPILKVEKKWGNLAASRNRKLR